METSNDVEVEDREGDELGFDPVALLEATVLGKRIHSTYVADESEDEPSLSALQAVRPRDMPKIDHLKDAVLLSPEGKPELIVPPGGRVIIERRSSILNGAPWIDTKVFEVREVDQENGLMKLWDPELHQHARDNWFVGLKVGSRYKLPPLKGKWDAPPKVIPVSATPTTTTSVSSPVGEGEEVKRRRGRPAGVKNRPKEVIQREKAEKAAAKAAKKSSKGGK